MITVLCVVSYGVFVVIESLLARYLNTHAFTELHLDSIFKYGDDNTLPLEVKLVTMFTCASAILVLYSLCVCVY